MTLCGFSHSHFMPWLQAAAYRLPFMLACLPLSTFPTHSFAPWLQAATHTLGCHTHTGLPPFARPLLDHSLTHPSCHAFFYNYMPYRGVTSAPLT